MADPRGSTGFLGLVLCGIVVLAATVFILSGGIATKNVESDADLPPVTSPTAPR